MQPPKTGTVVAAVADLIFGSRIRAAAEQAGVTAVFARTQDDLVARAREADLVLLDLEAPWLDAPAAIAALRADPATARVTVIAFGSHLATDRLAAARNAGADRVMARSGFVQVLPDLLRG